MTAAKQFVKAHKFLLAVAALYLIFALVSPSTSVSGLTNSVYYIKEMLMIMPPIFVLTALLDTWIPRETILKYMGPDSGAKGIALSFVLGSVAAGPIYAAFPVCVMLRKKDASIRNITIILSAWAVVKIPMLLNEVKFLGFPFMAKRWVLTVIAILIFSWLTAKIVRGEDMVLSDSGEPAGLHVDRSVCMGCGLCARTCPGAFVMEEGKAAVRAGAALEQEQLKEIIASCPVKAIKP